MTTAAHGVGWGFAVPYFTDGDGTPLAEDLAGAPQPLHAPSEFAGQVVEVGGQQRAAATAQEELASFVATHLQPRYGLHRTTGRFAVGEAASQLVAQLQELLNELWGYGPTHPHHIRVDGMLTSRTREYIRGFQISYNVGPGDGTPTQETLNVLSSEIADKRAMQARAQEAAQQAAQQAVHGSFHDFSTGQSSIPTQEPREWSGVGRGCPQGMWWDSLSGACRPAGPTPPLPLPLPTPPLEPIPLPSAGVHGAWEVGDAFADAERVQLELGEELAAEPWLRSIAIALDDANTPYVRVGVAPEAHSEVIMNLPYEVDGVSVSVEPHEDELP